MSIPSRHRCLAKSLILAAVGSTPLVALAQVPPEACASIARVREAASARDMKALRELMAPHFKWTLGPSSETPQEAIAVWNKAPQALAQLSAASGMKCELLTKELVQCPADAGMGYRAGFALEKGAWMLSHFLEGD